MADALVSGVLRQLPSIVVGELSDELKLLKGVEKEIEKLKTNFESISSVLDDAEKRRLEEIPVQFWVDQLKDICYDMEDVLDDWRTEPVLQQQHQPVNCASWLIEKVIPWISSLLPCVRRLVWKRSIALRIRDINQRLDVVVKEKDRFRFTTGTTANEPERPTTTSFVDVSKVYGRDHVKESLIGRLLSESSQEKHNLPPITAIIGMGGIGKTTLAQLAYNDENVKQHFDKRIWVCVSNPFNATHIARAIIEGLKGRTSDLTELQSMLQEISEATKNQKFLLILDDVWNEDYERWEPLKNCLKNGARGSKILVTTRSGRVANIMEDTNPISLEKLSTEQCWSVFSKIAFFGRSKEECKDLEEIGRKMSKRCKGLPLAAKVLGGLMRFKRGRVEWQNVLDSGLWAQEGANKELDSVFMLSYDDLPSPMKRCFTYCAMLPEDRVIERDRLIKQWMANGFLKGIEMEITGEEYFESLTMRSLFQDLERDDYSGRIWRCKMHDLVRDFALRVSRNECGALEVYKDEEEELMMKQEQEQPACAKLRHVWLICKGEHSSSDLSKFSIKGLRTLVTSLEGPNAEKKVLGGLFSGLTSLRALEFISSNIEELPVEIGKLMHLRYLGLNCVFGLMALPETVCDLCNLQTLNITYCSSIMRLPRGIGKLLNLRHLEFEHTRIRKLPKGIGELTSLRTLRGFKIEIICSPPKKGSGDGSSNSNNNIKEEEEEEYFGIGDFEKLNCLGGDLHLKLLGDLELHDVGEAKRARLKNKKNLRGLFLDFRGSSSSDAVAEAEEERAERHLLIAEALLEDEPPLPYVEELEIGYYEGIGLPSWITSLSRLKSLRLNFCDNLMELPETVCDLCNLQTLDLFGCYSIKTLPRGIGKLLNLRHLEFGYTGVKKLPKGIGELTSLRTLEGLTFSPPKNKSGDGSSNYNNNDREEEEEEEYFGIGDLEKLNCLEDLSLYGLGDGELLDDDVVGEAKRVGLKNKKNLRRLHLNFGVEGSSRSGEAGEERAKGRHLLIAEALLEEEAPTSHLERLEFYNYEGTELPSWFTSLSGLKCLALWDCPNLKELPGDFFERLPPLLPKVRILECPTLAEHCRRRISENSALASVFEIGWDEARIR